MSDKKKQQSKLLVKVRGLLLGLCLIAGVGVGLAFPVTLLLMLFILARQKTRK